MGRAAGPCDPPVANPIVCENSKPGNPSSEWDVAGAGDATIQGFSTDMSVNRGSTVRFKIKSTASSYRVDIYRLGFYGGLGARKVATVNPTASLPQNQPNCLSDAATGLVDCGNWSESASWAVPNDAVSGIYIARPVRTDTSGASHIVFVVRDDSASGQMLFQTSDTTWQAYNTYGGNSLYQGNPVGRAYKVSYNRPWNTRGQGLEGFGTPNWVFYAEYPMLRFLEANGYNLSYTSGVDSDRRGNLIANARVFLSVGHDEYWSGPQRANVEAARDAGTHLAFFSGNQMFWKTRWENSIDGSGTPYRTLVCYKETKSPTPIDPGDPPTWTGTWRDPRFSPPADGGRPENAVSGQIFMVNRGSAAIEVPAEDGKMRFWRNTSVATLGAGQKAILAQNTLGYEWDMDLDNGFRPAGIVRLSSTTVNVPELLQDYGNTYIPGTATHNMTFYRAASGARVFGAGTVQWPWGLDTNHDPGPDTAPASVDVRMQQATVNLLADMGSQPGTLISGLVAATQTTDSTAPTATISSPTNGASLPSGVATTITGSATDTGGRVGAIEVSTDNGLTWHPATGRGTWTYAWTPVGSGTAVTVKARAVDDSGNIQSTPASVNVTVGSAANRSLALNGTSGYADVAHHADLNPTGDWSLEAWVKDENGTFNHATSYIVMKGNTNIDAEASYLLGIEWGNLFAGERTGWSNQVVTAPLGAADPNAWHHVAATYKSSTRQVTLYLNGVQLGQGTIASQSSAGSALNLNLGRNGAGTAYWKGKLEEIRVWNVQRTAAEVQANFGQPFSTTPSGLVGYWKFNEGAGTAAVDSAGVAQNAILQTAGATWSTDVPPPPPAPDTTPPTITNVQAGSVTAASATIAWTTNETADTQVEYGTSTAYGSTTTLNTAMVTSHSQQVTGLTPGTPYFFRVRSKDAAGNLATSTGTFTTAAPDTTPPTISAVQATGVTHAGATITWTTNEPADSLVEYGTSTSYGSTSTLDPSLVTSHSQSISGLAASTTYNFRVKSKDASGNLATSTNGTFVTAAAPPPGSLSLNGTTAYAEAPDAAELNVTGDWTVESWFKEGSGSFNHAATYLVMKGDSNFDPEAPYFVAIEWNNVIAGERTSWGNQALTASLTSLTPGSWNHVAVTMKASTRQLTIYLNGAQAAQGIIGAQSSAGNSRAVSIGRNGTSGGLFNGKIDDVRIWNVVRSASEVSASYQSELSGAPTGLVGYWKFNDGAGATAVDSTATAQNATLNGSATWSTDVPNGPPPPDTTPPTISGVQAGAITHTSATVTWTTNEASNTQIEYGLTTSYGSSTSLDAAMVTSHSQQITGLTQNTTYNYRVKSRDAAGNLATSANFTFTTTAPDSTAPTISVVQAGGISNTAATITWTTNEASDTLVEYGATTAYGQSTTLNPSLVMSHSQALSGLSPNTLYNYRVKSKDASGNLATSGNFTFNTTNVPPNNSLSLNGTSAYAEAPHAGELNVTGDWTVETWFKDENPNYNHATSYILIKGDTNIDPEATFLVGIEWNNLFAGERTGWTNRLITYNMSTVSPNAWHHLAVTMTASTRQVTIYLDGVQVAQGVIAAQSSAGSSRAVSIGRNGTSGAFFKGKLDDVRIWNVVRTATQIQASRIAELGSGQTGLVGNWKFNEGAGTSAADSGGTAQNASLQGSAGWSTEVHP